MTLLWAFEQSRHAEIKTIQELSTVTSRAADFKCPKMSNRRTRATNQAVSRWFLITEDRVRSRGSPSGICSGQTDNGTVFLPLLRYSPVKYHSSNDLYSFFYHPVGGPQVQDSLPHLTNKTTQRPDARNFGNHNVRTTTN